MPATELVGTRISVSTVRNAVEWLMSVEIYVSTDVETDGPIPGPHSMLSFGSAAFTADGRLLGTFAANLRTLAGAYGHPDTMVWWKTQPEAWEACRRETQEPADAMPAYTKQRLGAFPPSVACDSCAGTIPPPEASVFQPGDCDPLVRIGDSTAAVAVCADIGTPAHAQRAAERGADTYLASMFVIPSDYEGEVTKLSRYAMQHRMLTALANFGGPSGRLRSAGRSAIWSETGEMLVHLEENGSGIAVVSETAQGRRRQAIKLWVAPTQ